MCLADKNRCKASYTGKYAAVNGTIHATRAAAPAHSAAGPCSVRISMKQSPNDRANVVESAACITSCVLTTSDGLVSVAAKAPVTMATTISLMVDDDDDEAVAVDIGVSLLLLASSEIALVAAVLLVVVVDVVVVATRLKSSYNVNSSMV